MPTLRARAFALPRAAVLHLTRPLKAPVQIHLATGSPPPEDLVRTSRLTVNVDRPDGPVVALVGAEALSIVRVPNVDNVVLGRGEEEVALGVVLDLC